jgi:transcriptional regulator with XRE-family HTH domain
MPAASPTHRGDPRLVALGSAIRAMRKRVGMSQEELASCAKLDRSYMSSVERGMQNPGLLLVLQIAEALGESGADLLRQAEI